MLKISQSLKNFVNVMLCCALLCGVSACDSEVRDTNGNNGNTSSANRKPETGKEDNTSTLNNTTEPDTILSDERIRALNSTIENSPEAIIVVRAQPSYTIDNGKKTIMPIHDESDAQHIAGRYMLSVGCTGSGTLSIHFSIGDTAKDDSMNCTDGITYSNIYLDLTQPKKPLNVQITPSDDSRSAIAYKVVPPSK